MANQADTTYKVTGTDKAVTALKNALVKVIDDEKSLWLDDLAKHFGIDFLNKKISVRGMVYWAEMDEDKGILSFMTESAWDACTELFEEINRVLDNGLSISFRVCECGCDVFYTHDEGDFFPEECCTDYSGDLFDGGCMYDCCDIQTAIDFWGSKTGIEQGDRTEDEMIEFINSYEYEDDDTFFYIHPFVFE